MGSAKKGGICRWVVCAALLLPRKSSQRAACCSCAWHATNLDSTNVNTRSALTCDIAPIAQQIKSA